MNLLNFDEFILQVNEGLIKTLDIEETIHAMNRYLANTNINCIIEKVKRSIVIKLKNTDRVKVEALIGLMNLMGWFPSSLIVYRNNMPNRFKYDEQYLNDKDLDITFESRFDKKPEEKQNLLYHVTVRRKIDKILKDGLCPKSNSRVSYHPDRVYLTTDPDLIIKSFNKVNLLKGYENEDFVILEIDNSDDKLDLYIDPNFDDGVYTYDNIRPEKIKIK